MNILNRSNVRHPAFAERVSAALIDAASTLAGGFGVVLNRDHIPVATVRYYGAGEFGVFAGNTMLNPLFVQAVPGYAARERFAAALGTAEWNAIVKHW